MSQPCDFTVWLGDSNEHDEHILGNKAIFLSRLVQAGFPIPDGFVVSALALEAFFKENRLEIKIKHLLNTINYEYYDSVAQVAQHIKTVILDARLPSQLIEETLSKYSKIGSRFKDSPVSIEISDVHQQTPTHTPFQHLRFENIKGHTNVFLKMQELWASQYSAQLIMQRQRHGSEQIKIVSAIIVQQEVQTDITGTIETTDPRGHNKSLMIIRSDENQNSYFIRKEDFLIEDIDEKVQRSLTDNNLIELANEGKRIERFFYFPQQVHWSISHDKIYILSVQPLAVIHISSTQTSTPSKSTMSNNDYSKAVPLYPGVTTGTAKIIHSIRDMSNVTSHSDILVIPKYSPQYSVILNKGRAIVLGERMTPPLFSFFRQLAKPAVSNANHIIPTLRNGMIVTVNGTTGEVSRGGYKRSIIF